MLTAISAFTLIRCCCYSEIVLLCDFPSRSNKQPVVLFCFQKTPKFDKSCCIEEKNEPVCFSGRFEAGITQLPKVKNTTFTIRAQFPGSQKHVSWLFQSCIKTHLWHSGPFHEKGCQGSVLWVLTAISVVTLIRWFCTVRQPPNKKWQAACFFWKTQKLNQNCCCHEEKNEPVCFSGRFEAGIIQLINVENTCFTIRAQFPVSQKHVSWQLQSCLKIHLGHIVPFHEKRCQGRLFSENWFPYLLLLGETILSGDFPAWSWKESVAFIKLQNLTKAIALMRKMKQCVFLAVLRLKLSSFHSVKILLLPSGPNSQVHKIMFPCSFRTV